MRHITRRNMIYGGGATTLFALSRRSFAASDASDGPEEVTWDLTELFQDDAKWEQARIALLRSLPQLEKHKGSLHRNAKSLEAACTLASDLNKSVTRIGTYAQCKFDADSKSPSNQRMLDEASKLSDAFAEATSWIELEILALGRPTVKSFIAARWSLNRFAFGFEETFRKAAHTPSKVDDKSLPSLEPPPDMSAVSHRDVVLSSGKRVHVDEAGFYSNRGTSSRADRRLLYDAYYGSYVDAQDALANPIVRSVLRDKDLAHKQGFTTSLSAKLFADNIPESVYLRLVSQVHESLPVLHRYYDLQRRFQKLPQAELFDLDYSFSSYEKRYSLAEMRRLATEAVRPLGTHYVDRLSSATAARWMDSAPRDGKVQGNRTNPSAYDVHPYLLLNLQSSYPDLSLFTHEWGHAMHSVLAKEAQPFDTYQAPIFLQEIASTLNETLLSIFLVEQAKTADEKLFYLQARLRFISTVFFEQAMLADFEYQIHQKSKRGEPLSGEVFTAIFSDLMMLYYGKSVHISSTYGVRWVFYSNFFFNAFYLFQYSTSMAAAAHFMRSITEGGKVERERYLALLAAGGSDYGHATLLKAGFDVTAPEAYKALVELFVSTLKETETLLKV